MCPGCRFPASPLSAPGIDAVLYVFLVCTQGRASAYVGLSWGRHVQGKHLNIPVTTLTFPWLEVAPGRAAGPVARWIGRFPACAWFRHGHAEGCCIFGGKSNSGMETQGGAAALGSGERTKDWALPSLGRGLAGPGEGVRPCGVWCTGACSRVPAGRLLLLPGRVSGSLGIALKGGARWGRLPELLAGA